MVLQKNGYVVKSLNLNNLPCSDRWALLKEVKDQESAMIFAKTILQNSNDEGSKDFWGIGQANLLKALALYVRKEYPEEEQNMKSLYKLITSKDGVEGLTKLFERLDEKHPAKQSWNIFSVQAGNEKVSAGMLSGLGTTLEILQSDLFADVLSEDEIELELPGKERCAYFIVVPDSHSTFDFIAGLFFTFAFIKLTNFADKTAEHELPIHVNFLMDEFPNIAKVPDFKKKISTIRSRGMSICIIFQAYSQLVNRYPKGEAEEILANCDTKIFLGANEPVTAEFISKLLGVATIETQGENKKKWTMDLFDGSQSNRLVSRNLMNPDEVLKQKPFHSIIMIRGQSPIKGSKMDYTKHSKAVEMEEIPVYKMMKPWSESYHKEYIETLIEKTDVKAENETEENRIKRETTLKELNNILNTIENKLIKGDKLIKEEAQAKIDKINQIYNYINKLVKINAHINNECNEGLNIEKYFADSIEESNLKGIVFKESININVEGWLRNRFKGMEILDTVKNLDDKDLNKIRKELLILKFTDELIILQSSIDTEKSEFNWEYYSEDQQISIIQIQKRVKIIVNKYKEKSEEVEFEIIKTLFNKELEKSNINKCRKLASKILVKDLTAAQKEEWETMKFKMESKSEKKYEKTSSEDKNENKDKNIKINKKETNTIQTKGTDISYNNSIKKEDSLIKDIDIDEIEL